MSARRLHVLSLLGFLAGWVAVCTGIGLLVKGHTVAGSLAVGFGYGIGYEAGRLRP